MTDNMDIIPAQDTLDFDIDPKTLPPLKLPSGVTSRFVETSPLIFHILESIPRTISTNVTAATRPPLILCIHGFPELAFSWRYILPRLASAGYHAVAFDQRGYGRTHPPNLKSIPGHTFRPQTLIKDTITLVHALGHETIHTLVGHDFGAVTATYLTLARGGPHDLVRSLVLMSHPWKGISPASFDSAPTPNVPSPSPPPSTSLVTDPYAPLKDPQIHASLSSLPNPRKHYKWYYCTRPSTSEMTQPTGPPLHSFLRGYFHLKSADWPGNANPKPHPLTSWTATELAKMPGYYVMPQSLTMRETVARDMADQDPSTYGTNWLPDSDLSVYVAEYTRTTFGPPMNWYRIQTNPDAASDSTMFAGKKIAVPTKFIAGKADWGSYQEPGALESMEGGRSVEGGCYLGTVLVEGAGHWVNQEGWGVCVEEILGVAGYVKGVEQGEDVKL